MSDLIKNIINHFSSKKIPMTRATDVYEVFDEFQNQGSLGTAGKLFARVKGRFLGDMYQKQKKKSSYFVTCVDDLIRSSDYSKEQYNELGISAIIKEVRNGDFPNGENDLISCNLAPLFKVKTAYTTRMPSDNRKLINVDFLQKGQQMETYTDLTQRLINGWKNDIDVWFSRLADALYREIPNLNIETNHIKRELLKDFVRLFLFKKYIICDSDLTGGNFGFIHSGDYQDLTVAPGFDYEYSFNNKFFRFTTSSHELGSDIDYLTRRYPEVIKKIIEEDFQITDKKQQQIKSIINHFEARPKKASKIYDVVIHNTALMKSYYEKTKKEMTEEHCL